MAQDKIFQVMIYRADGHHIEAFVSPDFKAAQNMYKGLDHEWVTSTAEKRPFRLPEPHLHCFAPSLISEMKVESMSKDEYHSKQNPYYQQMQREGFSGAMNQHFNNGGAY